MQSAAAATLSPRATAIRRRRESAIWLLRALFGVRTISGLFERTARFSPFGLSDVHPGTAPRRVVMKGAIHAHSTYSDGKGDIRQVMAAAREAGAQLLVMADHDTLQPLWDGWEGYHEALLVLIGTEVRTDRGYLLALGLPPHFPLERYGQISLDDVATAGGFAFAALPAHPGSLWNDCTHPALVGLEVLNLHSLSRHAASLGDLPRFLWKLWRGRPLEALSMFALHPEPELALWDTLLAQGRAAGLAAADAHGQIKIGRHRLEIPAYTECFQTVQTHLVLREPLLGHVGADREEVYRALREGRSRLVYPLIGEAEEFRFYYSENRATAGSSTEGEEGYWRPGGGLVVESPYTNTLLRLFRGGQCVGEAEGCRAVFAAEEPGAYRLEAYRYAQKVRQFRFGVQPWLFTNPIYLRTEGSDAGGILAAAGGTCRSETALSPAIAVSAISRNVRHSDALPV